ncbi:MAG TPA: type II toxin-antitoxin system VapC family toxin [Bryobacteraceae bacterium]|nr:type II toxin-antitoxin system VapC family toxin [Bryobacteraceae bacterium]
MTTALDTNVLTSLWTVGHELSEAARVALDAAAKQGPMVVSAPGLAELLASPGITEEFLDEFCSNMEISVEWQIGEDVWREAGRAYRTYSGRRRRAGSHSPRRILADFVIGAHASVNGYVLLTLDRSVYRTAFPHLQLITF